MDTKDLKELQENLQAASAYMRIEVNKSENAVIFFGYTKSGKSSLVNYMIDNELVGEKTDDLMPIFINRINHLCGPEIGLDASSKTMKPSRWESPKKLPGLALWDSPGYDDNRGAVQDITGAYYIYQIFKNVKTIKIVLIVDVDDVMNNRINSFIDLLHSVENLLDGKMLESFSSIVVIFTKVPDTINDYPANKDTIVQLLHTQFLSCSNMKISQVVKDYVQYLIENPKNIGLFKKVKAGRVTNEIEVDVTNSIRNATSIGDTILKFVKPSIADKSKVALFQIRHKLYSIEEINKFQKTLNDIFDHAVEEFVKVRDNEISKEKLNSTKYRLMAQLEQLKSLLDSDFSFHKKLNILKNIVPEIENKFDVDKLLEMSKLMEFIDALLSMKESQQINVNLQFILRQVVTKIDKIIIDIEFKLQEIDRKELEERTERLKENHLEAMKKLEKNLEEIKEHNKATEKELRLFTKLGNWCDERIDDVINFTTDYCTKFFHSIFQLPSMKTK